MTRWPWITALLAAAVIVSPPGQDVLRGLSSNESISRDMSRLLLYCGVTIAGLLLVVEWGIRSVVRRRRAEQ
ncbi:MAG: hypothetical protein AMXMBFR58_20710 [Phycisphaerae bacterium]|nr:hypothetical protein [Pseudorhodoplanes sp.]MBW7949498.1 hypothetical protein [Pseudorhodoplanes sp.]MCQ3943123.1 hypothetical protein [Alphaproteobacteria bacterium]